MILLNWQRRHIYSRLMRTDRPIGTYLVAWPALWALWLAADGIPPLKLLVVFLLGAFLMRSAGCVINDYADRDFDPQVARTQHRPLAAKELPPKEALQLFFLLLMLAGLLLAMTNTLTILLAIVAAALAAVYPFTKRVTHVPQVVLGMAFSWSIPMAFAAVTNSVPWIVWPLFIAVVAWVVVYDTFYAMVDRQDDLQADIKSTAILFGSADRIITALLQIGFIAVLTYIGFLLELGLLYFCSLTVVSALFVYQQYLIADRGHEKCFKAFLNNNYVGLAIFLGIAGQLWVG